MKKKRASGAKRNAKCILERETEHQEIYPSQSCAKRDEKIGETPGLKWNNMRVPTAQDSTQLSFQLVKKKGLRDFLFLKRNNKGKCLQMQRASLHPWQATMFSSVLIL